MATTLISLAILYYVITNPRRVLRALRAMLAIGRAACSAGRVAVSTYRALRAEHAPEHSAPRSMFEHAPSARAPRDTAWDVDPYGSTYVAPEHSAPVRETRPTPRDVAPIARRMRPDQAAAVVFYLEDETRAGRGRNGRGVHKYHAAELTTLARAFRAGAVSAEHMQAAARLAVHYRGQILRAPAGSFSRYGARA